MRTIGELCDIWSGGTPRKSVPSTGSATSPGCLARTFKAPSSTTPSTTSPRRAWPGSRLAPADAVLLLVRGMGLAKDLPVASITRPMAFNQDVKALVSRTRRAYSGALPPRGDLRRQGALARSDRPSAHGTMTLNLTTSRPSRLLVRPIPKRPRDRRHPRTIEEQGRTPAAQRASVPGLLLHAPAAGCMSGDLDSGQLRPLPTVDDDGDACGGASMTRSRSTRPTRSSSRW